MLKPQRGSRNKGPVSKSHMIPASTKGWLANEAISKMDPAGAVVLDNWFPEPDAIRLRHGSQVFASTPSTTPTESVLVWQGGASSNIFACTGGAIYDCTAGGAIVTAAYTGLSSNKWQSINFSTPGGQFLVAVNGSDAPRNFNGTAWSLAPAITGPANPNALIGIWAYKQRIFFIEAGTADAWYLAVTSIGGAATKLPLGSLLIKGGTLIAGATWTHDAGQGPQDYCVFMSSEGEVLVFAGTDPSSASTWGIIAKFTIGRPIGRRCALNVGADVVMLCSDGLMPGSQAMNIDRAAAAKTAFTWNIQKAFSDAYASYGSNTGWQILSYPKANMAIINVPQVQGITSQQFVMNVITGAWARFTGMNASCWAVRQDDLFFGDMTGRIMQAETGSADITTPISCSWISAYNDLGMTGMSKSVRAARPVFITDPGISPQVGVCVDYNSITPTATATAVTTNQATWDHALWDVAVWPAENTTMTNWYAISGDGYQIAAAIAVNAASATPTVAVNCKLASVTILYEPGGYF